MVDVASRRNLMGIGCGVFQLSRTQEFLSSPVPFGEGCCCSSVGTWPGFVADVSLGAVLPTGPFGDHAFPSAEPPHPFGTHRVNRVVDPSRRHRAAPENVPLSSPGKT